jgi:shikimate dehydrogenase
MTQVYNLDDLGSRELLDAGTDQPARLAVIGCPIGHSASPVMHQAALDAAGMAVRYVRIEVPGGQVAEALGRMRALGFIGCNVTVPHKLEVMAACDEVAASAKALGAVNTVRFDADGTRGFNTDGPGFVRSLAAEFEIELGGHKVAILGAGGGAGQALAAQCVLEGVAGLVLVNRTVGKLAELVVRLQGLGPRVLIQPLSFDSEALVEACLGCDLIVNASSVGLKAGDAAIVPATCLKPAHWVYDCIYQPPVTPLLAQAGVLGCRCANGRSMLLHQGALAFQHWFPGTEPLAVMTAALG